MKKISVIGSGTMGNGIAQTLALYEHDVVLYDINLNNLENANKTIYNSLSRMVNKNLISIRIDDYDDLMVEIKKEILSAKNQILIRLWSEELEILEKDLRKIEDEGVDIQLLSFTPLKNPIGKTFSYNIDPHSFTENWQRGIALFVDEERVVVGNKIGKYPIHGMLTNDPLIAESIKDQILLDVELVKNKREMRKKNKQLRENLCCLNDRISSGTCSTAVRDYLRGQNWRTPVHPRDDWKRVSRSGVVLSQGSRRWKRSRPI